MRRPKTTCSACWTSWTRCPTGKPVGCSPVTSERAGAMDSDRLAHRVAGLSPAKRALLEHRLEALGPAIPRRASGDGHPLSFAQQRLWFIDQLEPRNPLYHITRAVRLRGPLDVGALQAALDAIAARHEAVRTTFQSIDGRPVQRLAAPRAVTLAQVDL